jgi:quinol monooxygenase YgiN
MRYPATMILITLKLSIRPDRVQEWLPVAEQYAKDVSAEPGCVFFEWSRSLTDETVFVCNEGFVDQAAGETHMKTAHVPVFMETASRFVTARPKLIYVDAPQVDGWVDMGEIAPIED